VLPLSLLLLLLLLLPLLLLQVAAVPVMPHFCMQACALHNELTAATNNMLTDSHSRLQDPFRLQQKSWENACPAVFSHLRHACIIVPWSHPLCSAPHWLQCCCPRQHTHNLHRLSPLSMFLEVPLCS
jgi:hypothetical protein